MKTPRPGLRFQIAISDKTPELAPVLEMQVPEASGPQELGGGAMPSETTLDVGMVKLPPNQRIRPLAVATTRASSPEIGRRASVKDLGFLELAPRSTPRRVRARVKITPTREGWLAVLGPALKETGRLIEWSALTLGVASMILDHPLVFQSAGRLAGGFEGKLVSEARWIPDPRLSVSRSFELSTGPLTDVLTVGGRLDLDAKKVLGLLVPGLLGAHAAGHAGDYLTHVAKEDQARRIRRRVRAREAALTLSGEDPRRTPAWKVWVFRGCGAVLSKLGQTLMLFTAEASGMKSALERKKLDLRITRSVNVPEDGAKARIRLLPGFAAEVRADADVEIESSLSSHSNPVGLAKLAERAPLKSGLFFGFGMFALGNALSHKGRGWALENAEYDRLAEHRARVSASTRASTEV